MDKFFKRKVSKQENGCWLWTGYRNPSGYGRVSRNGTVRMAHRYAWEQVNGPMPAGMFACHTCDNRGCVNPDHIFMGTARDNTQDAIRKGRFVLVTPSRPLTHCKRGHEFTPENTISRKGKRGKACRTCGLAYDRNRRSKPTPTAALARGSAQS